MDGKIYICKKYMDVRMLLEVFLICIIGLIISFLRFGKINICFIIIAVLMCMFKRYQIEKANKLIKNGQLVWCKIDKMKSEKFGKALIVHTSYLWREKNQYVSYQGVISLFADDDEKYSSFLQNEKYIPVFVDPINRNKYAVALWDIQFTKEEIVAQNRQKQVIRVIDKYNEPLQ